MDDLTSSNEGFENQEPSKELKQWLRERDAEIGNGAIKVKTFLKKDPSIDNWDNVLNRNYILTSIRLDKLDFKHHYFNPRTPNGDKVKELSASISQLSLLSPLTCVSLRDDFVKDNELVYLIDGRHRYSALMLLRNKRMETGNKFEEDVFVDLKIFYDTKRSDAYLMSNYLNRSRRQLKPGEYYGSIVKIYDEKENELIALTKDGVMPKETKVFKSISSELKNKELDLSVGRIVGQIAFNNEDRTSWFGYIGIDQNERMDETSAESFKPMTAGVLFHLLKPLCYNKAYDDTGEKRAIEINNAEELGRKYKNIVFRRKDFRKDRQEVTAMYIACKTYVSMAFGELLRDILLKDKKYKNHKLESVFASVDVDWNGVEDVLKHFVEIMEEQAKSINEFKSKDINYDILKKTWSYQTQKNQVLAGLIPEMEKKLGYKIHGNGDM